MSRLGGPAIALFGSTARGDADSLSDRDLLLVADDPNFLRTQGARLRGSGWSPTLYSWSRLETAVRRGHLFVQHLKDESMILHDPDDGLAHALSCFVPKTDYQAEVLSATKIFSCLERIPKADIGVLWALDVAAVSFRSLAIARLANDGAYRFSERAIIKELEHRGILRRSDRPVLQSLRYYKRLYRAGFRFPSIPTRVLYDSVRVIDRAFRIGVGLSFIQVHRYVAKALDPAGTGLGWYAATRCLEAATNILSPVDRAIAPRFARLCRVIKAPSDYGGFLSARIIPLRSMLHTWLRDGVVAVNITNT